MIHRFGRLRWLPVVIALSSCSTVSTDDAPLRRPNVIFILLDDQGWADAGSLGHPYLKTPQIDRLVAQSARFEQFYVASPVCSPSRAAFVTGNYPARHRIYTAFDTHAENALRGMPNWLDPEATTVFDLARSAGYTTALFGKWHLGQGKGAPTPGAYGVDHDRTISSAGATWNVKLETQKDPYFGARSTGLFVDEAIRFMEAHRDQAFFVSLWTLMPHARLNPTPEELAVYDGLRVSPDDFPSWMRQYVAEARDAQRQMKVFCAAMTGLDAALGRLFDFLDAENLSENTVVFVSSDNGPENYHVYPGANAGMGFPGALRGRKRSLYEGGIRTPLLVRWPGRIEAGRNDRVSLLTAVDFLPTVASLIGAQLPRGEHFDGEDVSDVLLGESRPRSRPILWEWRLPFYGNPAYKSPAFAIRDQQWKLLVDLDGDRTELYRIVEDPEERRNLADRHPEVVGRLRRALLRWQKTLPPALVTAEK